MALTPAEKYDRDYQRQRRQREQIAAPMNAPII
jgi:hypothetical protein